MKEEIVRLREEITMQINALKALKRMAESYGYDISKPATNAKECPMVVFRLSGSY